ncbi:PQQ-binding-like beta-propeller repeat protein [Pelagibacteraceae bacterium]|nr:PQQ-binding-like beta-propeller repeat protein [Pelagibacteraceae bacterium]
MRTSLIVFICFFLVNCSKKVDLGIDIEQLKNNGVTVLEKRKSLESSNDEKELISKINLKTPINFSNWEHPNFNSQNLRQHATFKGNFSTVRKKYSFKKAKDNTYQKNIIKVNNKIIYVDDFSNLHILDENLNLITKFKIYKKKLFKRYPLKFSIISSDNFVYLADNFGSVLAFDLVNLKLAWKTELGVPLLSNLVLYKKNLFTTNSNGKIFSVNSTNGKINWSYETGSAGTSSHKAYKLAVANDKLLFSNDFADVYCIDLKKQNLLWRLTLERESNYSDVSFLELSNLVIEKNSLFLSSNFGLVLKVNIETGKIIWSNTSSSNILPIVTKNSIILANKNGAVSIFDKISGKLLFRKNLFDILKYNKIKLKNIEVNSLFLASNTIYVSTNRGFFFKINASNLKSITYLKTSKIVQSNLVFSDSFIYLISKNKIYKI